MLSTKETLQIAMRQSACDIGADEGDFLKSESVVLPLRPKENRKRYYKDPIGANFISYGSGVVAAAIPELSAAVRDYVSKYTFYHLFETPHLHALDAAVAPLGYRVCFMAEYYLLKDEKPTQNASPLPLEVLTPNDFSSLYLPAWSNALCESRKELDMLAVGAYDGGKLVGLAGASADAEQMWQIGVDVLPEYRRRGIAKAVTSRLAEEILARGKVPFYCTAWSNVASARNAYSCGFAPAWAEMTLKPTEVVNEYNQ